MSSPGRLPGQALAPVIVLTVLVALAPAAGAWATLHGDANVDVRPTEEGAEADLTLAATVRALGQSVSERAVEEARSVQLPVELPPTLADALPPLGERVSANLEAPGDGPDAPGPAGDVHPFRGGESSDDVRSQERVVTTGGPAWTTAAKVAGLLAAAGAAAWLVAQAAGIAGRIPGILPLYSRIGREDVLENDVRRRIHQEVRDDPGVCPSELAERVDVAWGTVVYHLDVLEENRLVTSVRDGRHRRVFERGGRHARRKTALSILRNDRTREILGLIRRDPGLPQKSIAERVGLTPQALHWHLERLREADLLEKERDGRMVRHYARNLPAGVVP